MENPFENGHIKNYLLFYASIVVIMVLFFIATSLFHDVKAVEPKVFDAKSKNGAIKTPKEIKRDTKFKLLEKTY